MTLYRLEVGLKPQIEDPIGNKLAKEFAAHGFGQIQGMRLVESYLIKSRRIQGRGHLNELNEKLFLDPVVHRLNPNGLLGDEEPFDWWVEVSFKPGVTDNAAHVAKENLELLMGSFKEGEAVASAKAYLIQGDFTAEQVEQAADQLLLNGLIEKKIVIPKSQWEARKGELTYFPEADESATIQAEHMDASSAESVLRLSEERLLALSAEEAEVIAQHYADEKARAKRAQRGMGPEATDVELECIAQTWSEHCKHKIFNASIDYCDEKGNRQEIKSLYKTFIQASTKEIRRRLGTHDWLLSVFKDNAGVVKFTDDWSLAFKVETHNSPSALDPYGGALTGIVGVNRDSFGTGMGAQLIANTDVFCFGPLDYDQPLPKKLMHPSRIYQGVRLGVEHGGNQSGIPTVNGALVFDKTFVGKPLVFCGTLSVMPAKHNGQPSEDKKARPGDRIVMVGGRIGKDGIHGATFSSLALEETSPVSAVQIGDPITQKRMFDFLWAAKEENLFSCITDNGAGGLSSSVGEMSEDSGGCQLHLDKAPLKYAGLQPWEILISEAQERMTLAVPPEKLERFLELSKEMLVESSDLGEFTDSGFLECFYQGELVACLDMEFLHDGLPPMKLPAQWKSPDQSHPDFDEPQDLGEMLRRVIARPNVCSKEKVVRQYDHEVGGASAIKPLGGAANDGPNDAGVLRPVLELEQGVALANGICPKFSAIDTYHMAANAIDESIRNLICVGADPNRIAGLDNFCWPDPVLSEKTPDGEYKAAQLVRACQAIYDYCLSFGVPCISGKDSMKNDANLDGKKISILPTLLFSALGVVEKLSHCATHDLKTARDRIYLLGETRAELGGSEYLSELGQSGGAVPQVDAGMAMARYTRLHQALKRGLVASVHDCSDGGLAVTLAEKCIGGRLGMDLDLAPLLAHSGLRPDELLFSESASRLVVSVSPEQAPAFEALFAGQSCHYLGEVTKAPELKLKSGSQALLAEPIASLKESWQAYLERF